MSKAKTDTYADAVEASRQRYRDAQAEHGENVSLLVAAREQYDELGSRLAAGDRSALGERAGLKDRIADLEVLAAGSKRKVDEAERGLLVEEHRLADTLVPVVEKLLPGLTVEVASTRPDPATVALPSAYIVQTKGTEADTLGGTVSGTVTVLYFRSPLHSPLNPDSFERLSAQSAISCTTRDHTRQEQACAVDVLDVAVQRAVEAVPVVARVPADDWRLSHFVQGIPSRIDKAGRVFVGERSQLVGKVLSYRHVDDRTDSTGLRRRAVEIETGLFPATGSGVTSAEALSRAVPALEGMAGDFATGLGRVESVAVDVKPDGRGLLATLRVTFLSQVAAS